MSNRRRPSTPTTAFLDVLVGQRLPGGCPAGCGATQTIEGGDNGVWLAEVEHAADCPWWAERRPLHCDYCGRSDVACANIPGCCAACTHDREGNGR